MLSEEYTTTQKKIKVILKDKYISITTDGWTSFANVGYVTCTAHVINQESWTLHSIVMGLFEKTVGLTADDLVDYCENQLTLFALSYHEAVSIVTDTEPTIIASGQIFVQWSLKVGGEHNG